MMIGFNQIRGIGTKIQRAFAPSAEAHVVGTFGMLQSRSSTSSGNPSFGSVSGAIKGLMINVFA